MTADASTSPEGLPNLDRDTKGSKTPKGDIGTRFGKLREGVNRRVKAIKSSFPISKESQLNQQRSKTDIPLDLRQEETKLIAVEKELGIFGNSTALALGAEPAVTPEATQTSDPLALIQELMSEPALKHLSKIESKSKTTRFLEREGRN